MVGLNVTAMKNLGFKNAIYIYKQLTMCQDQVS